MSQNQYHLLRQQRLLQSTREFKARGKSVVRCDICQLAVFACLCQFRLEMHSRSEFVLLMHRNEVFKPTNTGRLIADIFPAQTHVFSWHRNEPEEKLLTLLEDRSRQCYVVFPAARSVARDICYDLVNAEQKIATFILLDGSWKQGGRMFHLSRWLDNVPVLSLPDILVRSYAVRKSHQETYLATAEAAGLCLQLAGETSQSEVLLDYFALFNQHYLATRGCFSPAADAAQERMVRHMADVNK